MSRLSTDPLDAADEALVAFAAGPFPTPLARERAREALEAFRRLRAERDALLRPIIGPWPDGGNGADEGTTAEGGEAGAEVGEHPALRRRNHG